MTTHPVEFIPGRQHHVLIVVAFILVLVFSAPLIGCLPIYVPLLNAVLSCPVVALSLQSYSLFYFFPSARVWATFMKRHPSR